MGLLNPHLEDDDFADVWSARTTIGAQESDRPAESHLRKCAECRGRYASFVSWLDGIRVDAQAETDEIFGRERLATQQQQIFRRLESLEHPARVIAFPKFARPVATQTSGRRRWTAAAAAVGLITGIGLGQLIDFRIDLHRADPVAPLPDGARGGSTGRTDPGPARCRRQRRGVHRDRTVVFAGSSPGIPPVSERDYTRRP